ncbi:FAD-dependent oxidoreductase [Gordonia sp. NPDC003950]
MSGGQAGLASAVWLTEAGHRVTLPERRGSLGGRTIAMPVAGTHRGRCRHLRPPGVEHSRAARQGSRA